MLVVISPAKRLDWDGAGAGRTDPIFSKEAATLAGHARQLSLTKLKSLMGLSDDLARLNRDRFREFSAQPGLGGTRAAVEAFAGDTYRGLDVQSLDPDARRWAQDHLRILSGLYGVLRPEDAIQPYRLEMGSRLKTRRGQHALRILGRPDCQAAARRCRDRWRRDPAELCQPRVFRRGRCIGPRP